MDICQECVPVFRMCSTPKLVSFCTLVRHRRTRTSLGEEVLFSLNKCSNFSMSKVVSTTFTFCFCRSGFLPLPFLKPFNMASLLVTVCLFDFLTQVNFVHLCWYDLITARIFVYVCSQCACIRAHVLLQSSCSLVQLATGTLSGRVVPGVQRRVSFSEVLNSCSKVAGLNKSSSWVRSDACRVASGSDACRAPSYTKSQTHWTCYFSLRST